MRSLLRGALIPLMLCLGGAPLSAEVEAAPVFERLKSMAGTWSGLPEGSGEAAQAEAEAAGEVVHEFEVSAAGTVVMETMNPGSEHEMINMYHLDGDDLVVTHYCAGGNQPRMRLDRQASTAAVLVFDFTGGTNLDPEVDHHIHSAELRMLGKDRVESIWTGYSEGKPAGVMTFRLARRK